MEPATYTRESFSASKLRNSYSSHLQDFSGQQIFFLRLGGKRLQAKDFFIAGNALRKGVNLFQEKTQGLRVKVKN
jgi:hypothetical protein